MRSMTLSQVAHILNCHEPFPSTPIFGYCIDSRLVKPGELFFALKGERVDGHEFLYDVQKKGAVGAVVSKGYQGQVEGLCLFFVDDPLYALQEIARRALHNSSSRVVAITGSVGKTSTKEFTKTLLSTRYTVAASPGNSNSQVGVPLSILNHTTGLEEILILEMGMTQPGHLSQLVHIAPPEVALITTVALVHACHFESIEEIALTKAEIFSHPHTCLGILHRNISNYVDICKIGAYPKISFSTTSCKADYELNSLNPYIVKAHLEKQKISLGKFPLPGKHNAHNLLAAITVARYFNVDWKEIQAAMSTLVLPERRLQFICHKNALFLNDSYNASELSVKAAIETLPKPKGNGRKIAVLGSMLELGKFSQESHQRVGQFALEQVEQLYCLGEECLAIVEVWKKADRPVFFFENRTDLVACLRKELRADDVVLLKGSSAKELWKVLEEL